MSEFIYYSKKKKNIINFTDLSLYLIVNFVIALVSKALVFPVCEISFFLKKLFFFNLKLKLHDNTLKKLTQISLNQYLKLILLFQIHKTMHSSSLLKP